MLNETTTQISGVVEQCANLCRRTDRQNKCKKYSQNAKLYVSPYTI
jgi:hypothetical protein